MYLVLLVKKSQNLEVLKHKDEENVYEANFKVFKTLSPAMKSLTQNWIKTDLSLYMM